MARHDGRAAQELREIKVTRDYIKHPEGSCLIEFGDTRVICAATVEDTVPPFLKGQRQGWVTAEYAMLPRSCSSRVKRAPVSGRAQEIQRLIGRSLRSIVDLHKIGERTVTIDCDVIQADGGTRTASITGGFIALALALETLNVKGKIKTIPITDYVAAVSVGMVAGQPVLDLDYQEDSTAGMDMNVVMVGQGDFVEVQGTAEGKPFSKDQMDKLLALAEKGIKELFKIQKKQLGHVL
ncbi:MAG: ribonuclease PH [Candidatus Omnitrophica bacterium]|nr:ribonuclease PH [Candidatus Omnitrophota bacterium]